MHHQILRTWPRGRQALPIRAHNLFQNNGKRNLFSQNWSENDAKRMGYKISTIVLFARVGDKTTKTGTAAASFIKQISSYELRKYNLK